MQRSHINMANVAQNGGVYTPAVALGNTRVLERLEQCGMTFKCLEK